MEPGGSDPGAQGVDGPKSSRGHLPRAAVQVRAGQLCTSPCPRRHPLTPSSLPADGEMHDAFVCLCH